jgi:tripartite-type tricarboxylate transporter receptor subunit TctC
MLTGSIRAYAVTSDARITLAPDIPTFRLVGAVPVVTVRDVIGRLNASGTVTA